MMLENIAYACLAANGQYIQTKEIQRDWHAKRILDGLEKLVAHNCWPIPLVLDESNAGLGPHPKFRGELVDRPTGDWLTEEECKSAYRELGQLLHARNPLRPDRPDVQYYIGRTYEWSQKIVALITHHKIALGDSDRMWIVQVNTDGVNVSECSRLASVGTG